MPQKAGTACQASSGRVRAGSGGGTGGVVGGWGRNCPKTRRFPWVRCLTESAGKSSVLRQYTSTTLHCSPGVRFGVRCTRVFSPLRCWVAEVTQSGWPVDESERARGTQVSAPAQAGGIQ